jgi:sugar lactone lactonase YvrE
MKNETLKRPRPTLTSAFRSLPPKATALLGAWLFAVANLSAAEVDTVTGGPSEFNPLPYGYVDGDTAALAQFHTPMGIALDSSGTLLYVADRDNHAIRLLYLNGNVTTTFTTELIDSPVGVAVDGAGNVYVLNQGDGNNGTVLKFASPDVGGDLIATLATDLVNAAGIALDSATNIFVTVQDNTLIRITPAGSITTVVTIAHADTSLQGITVKRDGRIAAADAGRHGIYLINPVNGVVTTNSGFHGPGDFTTQNNVASSATAKYNQPYGVAEAGNGTLIVTDRGNHRVKAALTSGVVTNIYGVKSTLWYTGPGSYPGWWDGTVAVPDVQGTVEAREPFGVVFAPDGTLYTTETYYHLIRSVTGTGLPLPPPPPTPVPPPRIGWVDFTVPPAIVVSVLQTGPAPNFNTFVFNNDQIIAVEGVDGTETHYSVGVTPGAEDPSPTSGSTPQVYHDGLFPNQVPPSILLPQPDVTVKAINFQSGRPSSAVITARFIFKVASPVILGDNAAQFRVENHTTGAEMWYTLDGSDPTNAPPSLGPITGPMNLSLNITTNTEFKIRAFRNNYQPSEIAARVFSPTNFVANKISFGFASGEASSDFVASPGQFFYAPITLSVLPETRIYSLQFNVTVTNVGASPAVALGAVGFESFLQKPIPNTTPRIFETIPPLSFFDYVTPPPTNSVVYDAKYFVDMTFVNTNNSLNLIGVGWLERFTQTNLYNTVEQDLIKFSQPHDTLFDEDNGKVVAGGYAFQVPTSAQPGNAYRIQIGLPSATSDGIGAPGSDVYLAAPTNGSLGAGVINSIKNVTVAQRKYLAGDSAPFRWFNAGDFGNTNLNNSDVMQVFQSAIYGFNSPPFGSDFFDAMDTCGGTYSVHPDGYLIFNTDLTGDTATLNGLFNGNDTFINQIAFGNGILDVCDIFVTFRRSLDPSLTGFRRFWTNGIRGAETFPNVASAPVPLPAPPNPNAIAPEVKFSAGDAIVAAGQTLYLPVTAQIRGDYPLRLLALGITIQPLDGSPAITAQVQFIPNSALGSPSISSPRGTANYSAVWLNKAVAGLTGDVQLGTLQVTVPASSTANSAYAVHFDHASGSPNGLASFPATTGTGLITLRDRSASSLNDGISDSWRLRHFATLNNILASPVADADGDSASNWHEFTAGTNPNDASSLLTVKSAKGTAQSASIQWPSVLNKQYVIERAASIYSPVWTAVSTNNGTGWNMEYQDPAPGGVQFYRVRVQQ